MLFSVSSSASAEVEGKLAIAGRDGGYGKAIGLAVQMFQKQHPAVKIEQLKLPYGSRLLTHFMGIWCKGRKRR
jgi:hypothetical protein